MSNGCVTFGDDFVNVSNPVLILYSAAGKYELQMDSRMLIKSFEGEKIKEIQCAKHSII